MTAVIVLLACSLGVVFLGFMPDLALAAHLEPSHAWRASIFFFATYHLVVILGSLWALTRARARGEPEIAPRPLMTVSVAGGLFVTLGQFLTAAGILAPWLFFFYLLGLLWLLGIATVLFAILLLGTLSSPGD
jgi:hypothetical protein